MEDATVNTYSYHRFSMNLQNLQPDTLNKTDYFNNYCNTSKYKNSSSSILQEVISYNTSYTLPESILDSTANSGNKLKQKGYLTILENKLVGAIEFDAKLKRGNIYEIKTNNKTLEVDMDQVLESLAKTGLKELTLKHYPSTNTLILLFNK